MKLPTFNSNNVNRLLAWLGETQPDFCIQKLPAVVRQEHRARERELKDEAQLPAVNRLHCDLAD